MKVYEENFWFIFDWFSTNSVENEDGDEEISGNE